MPREGGAPNQCYWSHLSGTNGLSMSPTASHSWRAQKASAPGAPKVGRSPFFGFRRGLVCAASGLRACPLWPDLLLAGGPVEQQVAGSCTRLLLRPWAKWASCSSSPWLHTGFAGSASCCPHPHGASWWPPSFEPANVHPLGFCVQSWHGGCTSSPPLSITFPWDWQLSQAH